MLLSEGQMSDYKGAASRIDAFSKAKALGDKGHDAGWLRRAPTERGILPCIPSKADLSTASATENVFGSSRTGGASTPVTLDAPHTFI